MIAPPMKLRRAAVAVVVCLCAAGADAKASPPDGRSYSLTTWAGDNGQLPGDVFAIAQDVDGYLWLGTPAGLVRFDGSRFVHWPPDRGEPLPTGPVHAIVSDP